ncbi:MAG: hypothetical protein J5641_04140 [Bacteroidales bacterium]|nr:hypothetical protein [Bacteroidales bacterium]
MTNALHTPSPKNAGAADRQFGSLGQKAALNLIFKSFFVIQKKVVSLHVQNRGRNARFERVNRFILNTI